MLTVCLRALRSKIPALQRVLGALRSKIPALQRVLGALRRVCRSRSRRGRHSYVRSVERVGRTPFRIQHLPPSLTHTQHHLML